MRRLTCSIGIFLEYIAHHVQPTLWFVPMYVRLFTPPPPHLRFLFKSSTYLSIIILKQHKPDVTLSCTTNRTWKMVFYYDSHLPVKYISACMYICHCYIRKNRRRLNWIWGVERRQKRFEAPLYFLVFSFKKTQDAKWNWTLQQKRQSHYYRYIKGNNAQAGWMRKIIRCVIGRYGV